MHQSGDEVSDDGVERTRIGSSTNQTLRGDTTMFTKTALTAAIVLGTASLALATEQDPNLANRYATFNGQALQFAPVALQTRNVALVGGQAVSVKTYDREGASTDAGNGR
jgi:hypothetical protein